MSLTDPIVIVGAQRTAMGGFLGVFKDQPAYALGATAIRSALERSELSPSQVDAVYMGCVLPAGQGQAPARQAALMAGLPNSVPCTTINKMCGSGMQALIFAYDQLCAGGAEVVVAGGMESMSLAPYIIPKARSGLRIGHAEVKDHMFLDGLEDAYDRGKLMGFFADDTAEEHHISREAQDAWALRSLERARQAIESGALTEEIAAHIVGSDKVLIDESPLKAKPEKIPSLKPAFAKNGTVTAANASSISDGAAALVLMRESAARQKNLRPLAKILRHSVHATEPKRFTEAPVGAMQHLMKAVGWSAQDVDLFEINEAFAVVTLLAIQKLGLDPDRVNIHGGACALGHPIGASGARIVVTLCEALRKQGKKKGVASLCIGGGEATAMAVELF